MKAGQPSTTAERVALRRAAHQVVDEPRVFEDPLAVRIARADAAELRAQAHAGGEVGRGLRAFVAARSRYAEDELGAAVARGTGQYVILGAGLDTFAYRNPHPSLRVFEVDHPDTQAWKRERLQEAGIAVRDPAAFAPVDFERETLAEGLERAGFRAAERAFFSWLGVTVYLTLPAIRATLGFIGGAAAGSRVVFDYGVLPPWHDLRRRLVYEALAKRVAAAGEPWRTTFDPATLARELDALGLAVVEDLGGEELNARYFAGRGDGLRLGSLARLMNAER
jgi:methyltransferase (TIGR00027 family)